MMYHNDKRLEGLKFGELANCAIFAKLHSPIAKISVIHAYFCDNRFAVYKSSLHHFNSKPIMLFIAITIQPLFSKMLISFVVSYRPIPYIGNCSQKKMFADFTSLGAFVNIFLYYFLLITKNFN